MDKRIRTACEFLKDHQSHTVGELRLGAEKTRVIEVTGWSKHTNFNSLTKQQCLGALEEVKALFYKMVKAFPELKTFIKRKSATLNLYFEDYKKRSIGLCSEKDIKATWETDLR